MTNYVLLIVGCILVGLAYYHYVPLQYGAAFNVMGIVMMVHAIIWDK